MKNITNSRVLKTSIMTLGLMMISHNLVYAQNINLNNQPQPYQSNEKDPLLGGSGINPMQLIHNANFSNSRSGDEFAEDTNKNINSAAEEFRRQQQQRMLEMQKQPPSNPTPTIDN